MTQPAPPTLATWLLARLTIDEGLAGDVIEQFGSSHRSRAWLWRQVAMAILTDTVKHVQAHPGSLTGIVAGWAVLFAGVGALGLLHPEDGLPGVWLNLWPPASVVWFRWLNDLDTATLALGVFAFSGWLVGRIRNGHSAGLVAFVATIFAWSLSSGVLRLAAPIRTGLTWYAPHGPATFVIEVATYIAYTGFLLPLTALAGGLVCTRHPARRP